MYLLLMNSMPSAYEIHACPNIEFFGFLTNIIYVALENANSFLHALAVPESTVQTIKKFNICASIRD